MKKILMASALLVAFGAHAQSSPAGTWKTIDDDGKTEKSLVKISESGGVFTGAIDTVFDKSKADAVCSKCDGDRKDKPIIGLQIIRGVKADGDNNWAGGTIVDPVSGKEYKVKMSLKDGGKKLDVRGYIGIAALGRTQTWIRAE